MWDPGEAFVVSMAPTFRQVKNILWREINRVHRMGGLPGRTNQTEWIFDPHEIVGFGVSPSDTDPTAIQGIHARRVLFIGDEACGLAKALLDAADSLVANEDSRMLLIGNPDDPSSEFAQACKPGSGFNVIRISAFDSPNFTGEEVPAWLRPLLVSKTWVEERKRKWGEQSPLYVAKVTGEFPEATDDGLVPLAALRSATERELEPGEPRELGCDIARFGDDSTKIYGRRGPVAQRLKQLQKRDTMTVTGAIIDCARDFKPSRIKVDDAGLGGGVTDRLREIKGDPTAPGHVVLKDIEIIAINVGEGSLASTEQERFQNLRAELNWGTRERFIAGNIQLLPPADDPNGLDDLLAQGSAIKYKLTSGGQIAIEKKEDMKKRGLPSPDDWDALVLCFARPAFPGAGTMEFYRRESVKVVNEEKKNPHPVTLALKPVNGNGIRLKAPTGTSSVYGMSGQSYMVDGEHMVTVSPEDAKPLYAQGFTDAA